VKVAVKLWDLYKFLEYVKDYQFLSGRSMELIMYCTKILYIDK